MSSPQLTQPKTGKQRFTLRRSIITAIVLAQLLPQTLMAAPMTTAPQAPTACPASPSGLPDVIERTNFCVYYDDPDTTNAQATTIADHTQAYWDRYTTDFGFRQPKFSGKLVVEILDSTDCNGGTSFSSNDFNVFNGCFITPEATQSVPGHELFHRVQYSYGNEVRWFKEGTARTMEDLAFTNIDHRTDVGTISFSFNGQANEYLGNTNVDITSDPQRYNSALWWKYFAEQYGVTAIEPQRGVDAIVKLWEAADGADDVAAINVALGNLGAGTNFDGAFRRFAAANWIKDLANQPGTVYNYIDEDEVGNPLPYGPIVPTNGGTINSGTAATFNNQSLSRYGARYFRATPDAANCPLVSATFHTDAGPAFYHVITQKGTTLDSFSSATTNDWTQAFFNDGLTSIVAIAGATNASAQADITLSCANPVMDIKIPNSTAKMNVGPFNGPGKFLAQVLVTNGNPKGPVIAGLTVNDFKAKVNGQNALITAGGFIQQQYWLVIEAPTQSADGLYDLEILLEKSGTTTVIATDTNASSVNYSSAQLDHVMIIDRSGSMTSDNKMIAARQAAKFYVDITRNGEGVAVVPFDHNVSPAPFGMTAVTAVPNVRLNAKTYIDGLNPGGATSIGDGLFEAVQQRNASTTGNPSCSFVLLSDGMENSAQFWADVQADVQATTCPVTSIAFGAASDETLMQNIATATGGQFFYNDVFVSSNLAAAAADAIQALADTYLDLGNVYEYAEANSEGRQRLLSQKAVYSPVNASDATADNVHKVFIDDSVGEALFAVDWSFGSAIELKLIKPDGTEITKDTRAYDFLDFEAGHLGWRINNPEPGEWQMVITRYNFPGPTLQAADAQSAAVIESPFGTIPTTPYQVIVSARTNFSLQLLLPDRLSSRYFTGNRLPIYAFVSGKQPVGGLKPIALVMAPNGAESRIPLFDDGQHDDGAANDGLYAGFYTRVNQAIAVAPSGEDINQPKPRDEGSYRVHLLVQDDKIAREAFGSFSVEEGADSNQNGLPDPFEQENNVVNDSGDPDLDLLDNLGEYQVGTDPNNSDTDGGGENDGSEFSKGKDPFDPADDGIVAPNFLAVTPNNGFNEVRYDVRPGYNRMVLYRATAANGPWSIEEAELPNSGVYSDTADNGTTYFYRYMAIDGDDDRSAVIDTNSVKPATDAFAPEAVLLINDGAAETAKLTVTLSFAPYGEELEFFNDITEMKLSNDPLLTGADWQPFQQDVAWQLANTPIGERAKVYAQFRDAAANESLIVQAQIKISPEGAELNNKVYLPVVTR